MKKKVLALLLATVMLLALAACGGNADKPGSPSPANTGSSADGDVAGTYSVTYSTQEISGNVRHTGYITSQSGEEKNTLELNADGTYRYTKMVSTDPAILSGEAPIPEFTETSTTDTPDAPDAPAEGILFSWSPNNEGDDKGTCTLDFYADGTYVFEFPSYGLKENGTWSWSSWTMTVTKPSGTVFEVAMDEANALYFDYISDANEALHQNFIAGTDAWGVALGPSGSYTPVEGGGETGGIAVTSCYAGETVRKTADGEDYDLAIYAFLLSDGTAYIAEINENNTSVRLGSWTEDGGAVTLTDNGNDITAQDDAFALTDATLTKTDAIPADYQTADWAGLIAAAQAPVADGPVVLVYTFTGTYTADGNTVTLSPASDCEWMENWGKFQGYGFVNSKGTGADPVQPKGPSNETYLALDHFGGSFLIAPESSVDASVVNNVAVKVEVDAVSGSFDYVIESAFD